MSTQARPSSSMKAPSIARLIAGELGISEQQVAVTIKLIEEGATVPFIARYRKERTGGLDDVQLRKLAEQLDYLTELAKRRTSVLNNIRQQGKLTPSLERDIMSAVTKVALEDLYAPYKQKRRTKATIAKEAGLEPLADETPRLVGKVRESVWRDGKLGSALVKGKEADGAKFSDYFEFDEPIKAMPSHRALALLRGQKEGVLRVKLDVPVEPAREHPAVGLIRSEFGFAKKGRAADDWLVETAAQAWKTKLAPSSSRDLISRLKETADGEAIKVFSRNMHDLLLAAPAGPKTVMGIDPGIRTGCKIAIVDATGKLLDHATIYPHEPRRDWSGALTKMASLCKKHKVELVSIGNGTAGRETEKLVAELSDKMPALRLTRIMVSEAGASVYSASELASKEFPDLDVSIRGAVSIARRLQDPLAELVKIEPKAIGVGQYQHDVDQAALSRSLDGVVEDCVSAVGVDVNTASAPLLARVSGLNATIAANIVAYRDKNGPFKSRSQLKKVPRLGPKAYEMSAGFLRIMNGKNPLDGSAVHPEAYSVVEKIAKKTGRKLDLIIGDKTFLAKLQPETFADEAFGVPTVADILAELEKPGRDPRPEFKTAGLVHISELADTFVKDPHTVVKTGQVVRVLVKEIDEQRGRIGLSMKSTERGKNPPPATRAEIRSSPSSSPFDALSALK